MEKLFLGFGFLIASCLALYSNTILSSVQVFGLSISAFLLGLSGVFDSPLEEKKRITATKVLKIISYGVGIIVIAVLPTLENNAAILSLKNKVPDSVFLLSALGFSFITMYLGDIYKKKFKLLIRRAKLEGRQDVLEEVKKTLEKKKK